MTARPATAFDAVGLTDAVLEAASSRGLLRRAGRDRDAGLVQRLDAEAGVQVLAVDGETVRLGPGGLAGAACTCPSRELCRHVLAAVLELRDHPGAAPAAVPTVPDALAEIAALDAPALVRAFGRAALGRAEAILAAAAPGGAVLVEPAGAACIVRIEGQPEVHYVAGQGPAGMVSRAADPKALHAAALLAVRRLRAGAPVASPPADAQDAPAARVGKGEAAFLDGVAGALRDAARAALASAPAVLEDRLLDLAVSLRADALPNLAGALRGIASDMAQRRARAASFDPGAALAAIARAYALTQALRRDGEDPRLRGEVRGAFAPHAALDLIGCGVALWQLENGARGATAHFVAPDAAAGPRWFSTTLARAAGQDPGFVPAHAAAADWVWGSTLAQLGADAFLLPDPAVDGDGRLSPRAGTRTPGAGGWMEAVARHPRLVLQDWGSLGAHVAGRFAPTLRRRGAAVQPVLLRAAAVAAPGFDAIAQAATLPVRDRDGAWLELRIGGDRMDSHLDTLAALPDRGAGSVLAVLARVEAGELVLSPIAVCPGPGQPLQHLDLPPPRRAGAPTGLLQRLQSGLALIGWPGAGHANPHLERSTPATAATSRLVDAAADETLALAELSGRMEDAARLGRLRGMAQLLEDGGIPVLGAALLRLADAPAPDRPHQLLVFTYALACWRQIMPALPLLVDRPPSR